MTLHQLEPIFIDFYLPQQINGRPSTIQTENCCPECSQPSTSTHRKDYVTLPKTAIYYNSYGDIAYVVENTEKGAGGRQQMVAQQVFVKTGQTRGDQVAMLDGIKPGDVVVTAGQNKLHNGSPVQIMVWHPPIPATGGCGRRYLQPRVRRRDYVGGTTTHASRLRFEACLGGICDMVQSSMAASAATMISITTSIRIAEVP